MSSLSRVILAFSQSDADVAAASSLALGFGQVGAKVDVAAADKEQHCQATEQTAIAGDLQ